MTYAQKKLVIDLLSGKYYLVPQSAAYHGFGFRLYEGNMIVVRKITMRCARPIANLLKRGSNNRYTLNLSEVRKLHGKTWINRAYWQWRRDGQININANEKNDHKRGGTSRGAEKIVSSYKRQQGSADSQQSLF